MNLRSPELVLTQTADSQTYVHTIRLLEFYEPVEVCFLSSDMKSEICPRANIITDFNFEHSD